MRTFVSSLTLFLLVSVHSQAVSAAVVFTHPNPQAGAEFGSSMAFVGDINGDGVPDLLVGAPKQDIGANAEQGQAYLISGATGGLILTLNNPFSQAGSRFGISVASAGDINGDGKNDLLVGAPNQNVGVCQIGDSSGCSVGQAFVFSSATGALLQTLNHPATLRGAFFGSAVGSSGDLNGDLVPDLIVGAPGQSTGVFVPGQAFVFSGAGGGLLLSINDPNFVEAEAEVGHTFGSVLASTGDINGDGKPDILVGDAQQNVGANVDQGQVHIFSGADGSLLLTLNRPSPQAGAFFGASAAVVGDIDGDGLGDVLIGAPREDVGLNSDQGRAYVFSGDTGVLLLTLDDPTPQFAANFGYAVAGMGDLNGDTIPDLLIGSPGQTADGNSGQGQAFIFSGANGSLLFTLNDPLPQRDANFGRAVASGGDLDGDGKFDPLVAAPLQTTNTTFQGVIGGFKSSTLGGGNQAPIANAGPDQTVNEGALVNLNGSGSSDPNLDPITFLWTQTAGPVVTLSNPASVTPTFTAPQVSVNTVLTFQLIVNDGLLSSLPDTANITVADVPAPPPACAVDFVGTISKLTRKTDKGKDSLSFTLDIFNAGTAQSRGSFKVKFYISADATLGSGDTLVFTKTLKDSDSEGRIKPGNKVNISGSVTVASPTQGKRLIAHIDSENYICESNEANNIVTRQIP